MSKSAFTPEEERELARLLKKILEDNYFIPEEAFEPLHGVASMWATELVITQKMTRQNYPQVLLTLYEGGADFFKGLWHIPGGYNCWNEPDIQTTCSRVAKRELGIDVRVLDIKSAYKWKEGEHPYGRPLSLYIKCLPVGKIKENEKMKFFEIFRLPENLVEPHRKFIEKYL